MKSNTQVLLGIDAGGTFTDFVSVELGRTDSLKIHKTLSTPAAPEQAILEGIRAMGLQALLESGDLQIVHGSTVATNAALEGKVARTVFVSNRGFGDMLQLARQTRPELYALEFAPIKPPVPAELCLETGGRLAADGEVLDPLTSSDLDELVEQIKALKPEAVAINLLFSFLDDGFEKRIEQVINDAGLDVLVSRSSEVLPVYKEYERGIATWLNACLGPVVSGYLNRLQQQIGSSPLQIMQSSGETIAANRAASAAVHLLLSGPAGGLAAMKFLGREIGLEKIISFDMGGTSTDVALLDGEITITTEASIDRYPVGVPMVDMQTIGAGGGSIAFVDRGGMLQVGPRSAGASPGPACYGRGGEEATVTDANLVLGRIAGAELADGLRLDMELARNAIAGLAGKIGLDVEETALGIVTIANEHMAKAIRLISVNRGHDPKEFVLASFGGAGGLHVCAVAEAMEMTSAIVPAYGGVLSALGMLVAEPGRQFTHTLGIKMGDLDPKKLQKQFEDLAQSGCQQLVDEGLDPDQLIESHSVDLRYAGQSYTLNVPWQEIDTTEENFAALHKKNYGYSLPGEIELVNLRVRVHAQARSLQLPRRNSRDVCNNFQTAEVYPKGREMQVLARQELSPGQSIEGPAIVTEYAATTYLAPGWRAEVDALGNLLLEKRMGMEPGLN